MIVLHENEYMMANLISSFPSLNVDIKDINPLALMTFYSELSYKEVTLIHNMSKRAFTVVIEGNLGSGKSTFLKQFNEKTDNVDVIPEPVDRWQNIGGNNLLAMMYEDPTRYSFVFQMYAQLTMLERHTEPCDKLAKIMERSLARYCFIENLYTTGKISNVEHTVLSEWFDYLTSNPKFDTQVDVVVYLRTSPEVAYKRILARGRKEEANIPYDYIKHLHELYEQWLFTKTKFQTPSKIIVIDADKNLDSLQTTYKENKIKILDMAKKERIV